MPQLLANHVNIHILPELNIHPKQPISLHTARHWLIQLGWHYMRIKKGVYEDGQNQFDVVLYCDHDFLPQMLEYE